MGKGEKAGYQHFLIVQQCFQNFSLIDKGLFTEGLVTSALIMVSNQTMFACRTCLFGLNGRVINPLLPVIQSSTFYQITKF